MKHKKTSFLFVFSIFVLPLFFVICSCTSSYEELESIAFEKTNWQIKKDGDYVYRAQMVQDVLYNDTIRSLNKNQIIQTLGKPDRINEDHLYYMIAQKRMGTWPLHTRTLVIKLKDDQAVDWIKLHE